MNVWNTVQKNNPIPRDDVAVNIRRGKQHRSLSVLQQVRFDSAVIDTSTVVIYFTSAFTVSSRYTSQI